MYLVGLTGGISSGKSAVSRMLENLGCVIIDADLVAREVVQPGQVALVKIRDHFGAEVFREDGTLDRDRLGEIIFADSKKRRLLNSITHPEIYKLMVKKVFRYFLQGKQFVVLDLPLLFETSKLTPYLKFIAVVYCNEETQLERLMARNNLSKDAALQRINAQISLEEKCNMGTHVIDNSGDLKNTEEQVKRLYAELSCSKAHWKIRAVLLMGLTGVTAIGVHLSVIIYRLVHK